MYARTGILVHKEKSTLTAPPAFNSTIATPYTSTKFYGHICIVNKQNFCIFHSNPI